MSNSDCVPAISDEHFMIDACPNRKDLSNYVIGATDDETAANIDSHLAKCETCRQAIASLDPQSDELIRALADKELLANVETWTTDAQCTDHDRRTEIYEVGDRIGLYRLTQKIGEGGMGLVFKAEQTEPVKRTVALKVVKAGMDTKRVIARFEAERQALAMMDHPGIARVLDAGATRSGRPYFVMEFVAGSRITDYCDEHQLDIRSRLELFRRVCQAVHHAHQKGVIHRDLKPSNLLVSNSDDAPLPKVIDFGLAKATEQPLTDHTRFTRHGQVVGTLEYMSPEQAGLSPDGIDTRTDIYSLGIVLYELLTGMLPIDAERMRSADVVELIRIIKEEEPAKPSARLSSHEQSPTIAALRSTEPKSLVSSIRGDLDWIVLKCLSKDKDRRYESANVLAKDVERYLADEPIDARPPSATYRLTKLYRRNKIPVIAAVLLCLTLFASVIATSRGWIAASRRAEQLKKGNELLAGIFREFDIDTAKQARDEPIEAALKDRLIEAGKQLDSEGYGSPLSVAEIQRNLGSSLSSLGAYEEAQQLLEKSSETFLTKLGPNSPKRLDALNGAATSATKAGNYRDAAKMQKEVYQRRAASLGDDHLNTLSAKAALCRIYHLTGELTKAHRMLEEVVPSLINTVGLEHPDTLDALTSLAAIQSERGEYDKAIESFQRALKVQEQSFGPTHISTLLARNNLGYAYSANQQLDKAIPIFEKLLKDQNAELGNQHPQTLSTLNNLASAYVDVGDYKAAQEMFETVLKLRTKVLGSDHPETLQAMHNLAFACEQNGSTKRAIELYEKVLAAKIDELGKDHPDTISTIETLGWCYSYGGEFEKAFELLGDVVEIESIKHGKSHPRTVKAMNFYAGAHYYASKFPEAIKLFVEVIELSKSVMGPGHPETLNSMANLAGSYMSNGDVDQAMRLFEELLPLQLEVWNENHPNVLSTKSGMMRLHSSKGNYQTALELGKKVLAKEEAALGLDDPQTLVTMSDVASIQLNLGDYQSAIMTLEKAASLHEKAMGAEHQHSLAIKSNLARACCIKGELEKAKEIFAEVLQLQEPQLGSEHPSTLSSKQGLAVVSLESGNYDEAVQQFREIAEVRKTTLGEDASATLDSLDYLAQSLLAKGDSKEAREIAQSSHDMRMKSSPESWLRYSTQTILGHTLTVEKDYDRAEPLLVEANERLKQKCSSIPAHSCRQARTKCLENLIVISSDRGESAQIEKWKQQLADLKSD